MNDKKSDSSVNVVNQIARQLFAMGKKSKQTDLAASMENERFQRTFTDEHYPNEQVRAGFKRVPSEQKAMWRKLAARE